ncbi:TPA: ComC/BlpC family leader-containing pheromone/bacteriocin [Streptococcus suis]|uniref:ComC/BlpC family leader-containing pheromone/bacteriocin n=1 Tax=Streptococcus suis TaxID=1307 RepID=UPI000CF486CA|nr:ComC/BlpC family leader-containing pheromone/bacteriocin [Streptococcus suis]MBS8100712.1 ComC/BlpC family leader-containing pheromone/bacteriocin [Streptococcus suis]NQJ68598.1 ComC/BlpC family leader-containing pheromone/bacteriocin [Streptococcus suis]NQJ72834.1 ComC/BlpC family leader-containing pheromone/bacteriocin [Streptococcus suis]NQJ76110.1 ComC/BlpC family leader-containing pheromone/bacteriocin [Streptococcus suis]NQN87872.1 ComC/BlpC family leader-containing pheromone/bacterio
MNTQTISQFELLDTELLATVEGGNTCAYGVAGGVLTGVGTAAIGLLAATNPVGWVVGSLVVTTMGAGGGFTGAALFCR